MVKQTKGAGYRQAIRTLNRSSELIDVSPKMAKEFIGDVVEWLEEMAANCDARAEAGRQGGRPPTEPKDETPETKEEPNANQNETKEEPNANQERKKERKEGRKKETYPAGAGDIGKEPEAVDLDLARIMRANVLACLPGAKVPSEDALGKWADGFRKLRTIDKLEEGLIREILAWMPKDPPNGKWPGWGTVCRSPDNLRENWDKIIVSFQGRKRTGSGYGQHQPKPASNVSTVKAGVDAGQKAATALEEAGEGSW